MTGLQSAGSERIVSRAHSVRSLSASLCHTVYTSTYTSTTACTRSGRCILSTGYQVYAYILLVSCVQEYKSCQVQPSLHHYGSTSFSMYHVLRSCNDMHKIPSAHDLNEYCLQYCSVSQQSTFMFSANNAYDLGACTRCGEMLCYAGVGCACAG